MSDRGPAGPFSVRSTGYRNQVRAELRLAARHAQKLGTLVRELEAVLERLRDRETLPTSAQAEPQIVPRFEAIKPAFRDLERTLAELLSTLGI